MDKVCVICFEEMDMKSFEDEQDQTATSFKLECGHAYHTRCIVSCLQRTQHKCPQCNSHKTPEKILTMEGLITEVFDEVRKTKDFKEQLGEYRQSRKDLDNTIKTLKNDVKQFVEKRKEELEFSKKKSRYKSSMRSIRLKFGKLCREKGPLYSGASSNTSEWRRTRLIFPGSRNMYRRAYPHLYVKL